MLSFHGEQEVKDKYLARVRYHIEMDNIIQGTGWENGKGCAVGCTLENYDHSRYPIELGLPEWIARLEDLIFEGLPIEESRVWPERFLSAIPVGVDVENVKYKLSILRLNRLIQIQSKLLEKNPSIIDTLNKVISAIETVKKCHEAELNKSYYDWSVAALSAAVAAESAAADSAWAAESESATRSQ